MRGEEVLLSRRFNTGYEDGKYSVPAGHVDEGESVADALIREAKEEIGIDIQKQDIVLSHVMHRKGASTSDERLDFFFICREYTGEVRNIETNKCDDLRWSAVNNLPENTIPYVKAAIHNSLTHTQYSELNW